MALLLVDECLRCGSRMGVGGHPACRGLDRVQNRQQVPSVGTHRSVATPALLRGCVLLVHGLLLSREWHLTVVV